MVSKTGKTQVANNSYIGTYGNMSKDTGINPSLYI